ncbi:hypothetical protein [Microbacterium sp. ZW T5_56]|uniref:hypothetical protein n=1 Tax=Microbacterium sp. ZW T5_56 TaxID=3378081 RepID=UPI003854B114
MKRARLQLLGGPPVVTPLRDADAEVQSWLERRTQHVTEPTQPPSRQWFRRNR